MSALFLHALRSLRGQVLWYGIGLGLWAAIVVVLFVSLEDSFATIEYPQEFLDAFGAQGVGLDDPRGYLSTEFFSLATLVAGAFVVFASTGALAGEEAGGRMEMLATLPLSRLSLFTAKVIAVVIALFGIIALTVVGWLVAIPFVDLGQDIDGWKLAGATVAQIPYLLFILATGMFFGAVAPTRSSAAAWTGAIMVLSYLLVAFGSIDDSVSALKYMSPYYYADLAGILVDGVEPWHLALLLSVTAAVGYAAERAFEGRELGSERWQWSVLLGPPRVAASGLSRPAQSRGSLGWWWIAAAALVVVVAAGGAVLGSRYVAAQPPTLTVDGRVDAESATVFAPTSGIVRVLTVARGDAVAEGDTVGWMESADGASVPITTTMRGQVTSIAIEHGQFLLAGSPLLVVYDLRSLHVTLTVDEADIHRLHLGDSVEARFTTIGVTETTRVSSIASVPQPIDPTRTKQARKYEVEAPLVDADPRILVGMPVKALVSLRAAP